MARCRRNFRRHTATRDYRKVFIIAAEGSKTEHSYFHRFNNRYAMVQVECLKKGTKSAPHQVLNCMEQYLEKKSLRDGDQAWLVIDKDEWSDNQLLPLHVWASTESGRGLAVSTPSFEYWLLLHYEDGRGVTTARNCIERLKRYIKNYSKSFRGVHFSMESIENAIQRAKQLDTPRCKKWPRKSGSTVYRLVEEILKSTG